MPSEQVLEYLTSPPRFSGKSNPVLSDVPLPLRETFFPLGYPIEIATNSNLVLDAARESWSSFSQSSEAAPLLLELGVSDEEGPDLLPPPVCRTRGSLLSCIADSQNFIVSDLERGFAFGWISRRTAEASLYLRYYLLEAVCLSMLSALRVVALHAACVAIGNRGMLLCGDSGAGKSSLAFAGARSGWTYISDDASYLALDHVDRVVSGNCHQVRLRDSAPELFPELRGRLVTPRIAGKPSIEMATSEWPELVTAASTRIDYIVFLNRSVTSQGLFPFSRAVASEYFRQSFLFGPAAASLQGPALDRLLNAKICEMRYTNLDWAIECLEELALTAS
jgi:hypothetical protein